MLTYKEFVKKLKEWHYKRKKVKIGSLEREILIFGNGACCFSKENCIKSVFSNERLFFDFYKKGNFQFLEEEERYFVYRRIIGEVVDGNVYFYWSTIKNEEWGDNEFVKKYDTMIEACEYVREKNNEALKLIDRSIDVFKEAIETCENMKKEIIQPY